MLNTSSTGSETARRKSIKPNMHEDDFNHLCLSVLRVCPRENQAEPGRRLNSSDHRFRSNLAQMLGLVNEQKKRQKSKSKYFIPFKLGGSPAKMAIWH